ncbi:tRNA (guanine-N(1)-)-methyltransferase TrmD [Gottschalkia acidurici 9a]|uniref:tRNA (guanine-N(1)-)-methyltransferase n=1 Tax=Gottschalkia acidurici (strain ATCC 7906 / DSM 604 / BCRC 14475 / CIP 104303 / KCTC 5404 / NCIMB 10678 / 9a) TaxID=1128398 RepID=K0AXU2_GOTA9|nr:tRNA (guanosine(37)-N1)-methyltransferase TrmD [Gottschalkia acidurici]AFS78628.1 tRNA (guanine-N(1)-)-methyltransferase TrmD [Gottschalkia acidurici 9a]
MKIDVLTLFPEMFEVMNTSIIGRAIEDNLISVNYTNIRDFSEDKHRRVDDYSYGGGPGMVMKPEPIYRAIMNVKKENSRIIYLSPKGKVYDQNLANELSKEEHLVLLCGHYEGIDQRIIENCITEEISIGDYVLTGGELASMVIIDSVARLIPGVLAGEDSFTEESHYNGLLEYPQYTRPQNFNDLEVPEVLLSGNHKKIDEWRKYHSLKDTYLKRPDLLKNIELTKQEKLMLEDIIKELGTIK